MKRIHRKLGEETSFGKDDKYRTMNDFNLSEISQMLSTSLTNVEGMAVVLLLKPKYISSVLKMPLLYDIKHYNLEDDFVFMHGVT